MLGGHRGVPTDHKQTSFRSYLSGMVGHDSLEKLCGGTERSMYLAEPALNLKQAPMTRTWARGRKAGSQDKVMHRI